MLGRRPLACLVAMAALAGLPACASSDDEREDSADVTLERAARVTEAAGGARFRMDLEVQGASVATTGYVDLRDGDMTMSMELPGAGKMQAVMVELVEYLRPPDGFEDQMGLSAGRHWLRIDLRDAGRILRFDPASMMGGSGGDPHRWIEQLGAATSVETVGHDSVDGVQTTHLKATLDLRKMVEQVPEDQRASARRGIEKSIEELGTAQMAVEVWIDGEDRIRHLEETLKTRDGDVTIDMELYDYGAKESIAAPPSDEVQDISATDLAGMAAGG
jgi:hypothetical protein